MDFLSEISSLEYSLAGAWVALWLYQLYFWARYMAAVLRRQNALKKGKVAMPIKHPPVSVVISAKNEGHNLQTYLQMVLSQDYPEYEVIVVNDASEDNTREIVEAYQHKYKNLHLTFVPREARINSSKKLALTLAAKASRYDYLLLTDADCRPESTHWIEQMMTGFVDQAEIVIGYSPYFHRKGMLNRIIRFDTLFNGLLYMGATLTGKPYMGVGRNLAYKKSTFFEHKGFAGLLDQKAGDDDLFVNKVATRKNANAVVTAESLVWSVPKYTFKEWVEQKMRHLSVSPRYKTSSKVFLTFEPLTRFGLYGLLIAIALLCQPIVVIAAIGLMLIRWIWQSAILSVAARRWHSKGFCLSIPLLELLLPLMNILLLTHNKLFRRYQRW